MRIRVSNTKFCLIINKEKIGSQYVRAFNNYENNRSDEPDTIFELELVKKSDNFIWNIEPGGPVMNKGDKNGLDSFLNGTISKDVIILIRDPFERFISAFNQDFIKPLLFQGDEDNLYILGLSILKNNQNKALFDWWLNSSREYLINNQNKLLTNSHQPSISISYSDLDKTFELCMESIFRNIIDSWLESNYDLDYKHNSLYHYIIVNMLFKNKNKFKIFDIDNVDMNDIFSKYFVGINHLGRPNQANFTKRIVSNIFNRNIKLKTHIMEKLKVEYMAYGSLKKLAQLKNN